MDRLLELVLEPWGLQGEQPNPDNFHNVAAIGTQFRTEGTSLAMQLITLIWLFVKEPECKRAVQNFGPNLKSVFVYTPEQEIIW